MLPQSIRRQQETDIDFKATRQRILDSTTKELFNNLTALKHWSYMMPDTLEYKANTKLRDLIGINFPVPDYCIELTMEVEGWEDKTIQEVENRAVNMVQ